MTKFFLIALVTLLCSCEPIIKNDVDTIEKIFKKSEFNMDIEYTCCFGGTKEIGACNFAWGNVESICGQLTDCEVIYRVKDNIWGKPAVDKYGLGK